MLKHNDFESDKFAKGNLAQLSEAGRHRWYQSRIEFAYLENGQDQERSRDYLQINIARRAIIFVTLTIQLYTALHCVVEKEIFVKSALAY